MLLSTKATGLVQGVDSEVVLVDKKGGEEKGFDSEVVTCTDRMGKDLKVGTLSVTIQ